MMNSKKLTAVALFASLLCLATLPVQAEDGQTGTQTSDGSTSSAGSTSTLDGSATNSASNANVSGITAQNSVGNDAQAMSGGNVFDFSNGGKSMGMAPALPTFAGGPCMGVSGGLSASLPGIGIGGGRSFDDESCQRRNWVQTLIGSAERMPEVEANELKRVAIVVMMQDPILAPAFRELGYNVSAPGTEVSSAKGGRAVAKSTAGTKPKHEVVASVGAMAQTCNVVVPKGASDSFVKLVEGRGCLVKRR